MEKLQIPIKEYRLKFKGSKIELLKQLRMWCYLADQTPNKTVLELIEKFLEEKQKSKN
jgi:hypothetical protein